jgi:hypothetical protein
MFYKILLSFSVLLFFVGVNSYAQKGSWYVGGQVGFNTKTEKNTGIADINTST